MRIAVAGLGFMGSTHLKALRNVAEARLAAVVSSDERKLSGDLSDIQGNLGGPGEKLDFGDARRYKTFDEALADESVEAVDICLPSHLHAPCTLAALRAGKHVLVEKPMALSVAECEAMVAAAEAAGRVLMVAQVLRFFPDYKAAAGLVNSGRLGDVRSAFFRRRCAAPFWSTWAADRAHSGGGVFDLLIHDADFAYSLFGYPRAVSATGHEDLAAGIDVITAQWLYERGPSVCITGGWHHPKAYPFSMEFTIVCENGTLEYSSAGKPLTLYDGEGNATVVEVPQRDAFEAELEYFLRCASRNEQPAICPPRESAVATRLALATEAARAHHGEPVECNL